MKCSKCGSTGIDKHICDDCMEDEVFKEMKADVKAGAIACYFASPLALREQYGTEMKINLSERMKWYREDGIAIELFDYIEYLEGLLCKVEGE